MVTIPVLFTGWWLLTGREGAPSPLALAFRQPDSSIHLWLGWLLGFLAISAPALGYRRLTRFAHETLRYDTGDVKWLLSWPKAIFSGDFGRHECHFDPGQRLANIAIVSGLVVVIASGVGLALLTGGPAFMWLHKLHTWATLVLTPVLAEHVLIALGVLPGYRGVWRSMHVGRRVSIATAMRVWPGWTERLLSREVRLVSPTAASSTVNPSESESS